MTGEQTKTVIRLRRMLEQLAESTGDRQAEWRSKIERETTSAVNDLEVRLKRHFTRTEARQSFATALQRMCESAPDPLIDLPRWKGTTVDPFAARDDLHPDSSTWFAGMDEAARLVRLEKPCEAAFRVWEVLLTWSSRINMHYDQRVQELELIRQRDGDSMMKARKAMFPKLGGLEGAKTAIFLLAERGLCKPLRAKRLTGHLDALIGVANHAFPSSEIDYADKATTSVLLGRFLMFINAGLGFNGQESAFYAVVIAARSGVLLMANTLKEQPSKWGQAYVRKGETVGSSYLF